MRYKKIIHEEIREIIENIENGNTAAVALSKLEGAWLALMRSNGHGLA